MGANIRNCSRCGSIYVYDGFDICLKCRRKDEDDFQRVKKYIDENPGANTNEISEETEVEASKIIEFLRQGRLEITDDSNILLDCERCGKPIKSGRFCKKCIVEMQREMKKSIGKASNSVGMGEGRVKERIRIIDKYREK